MHINKYTHINKYDPKDANLRAGKSVQQGKEQCKPPQEY